MNGQPAPTAAELARECHQLVEQLKRHRLNVRLLLGAREMLRRSAGYKANRHSGKARSP